LTAGFTDNFTSTTPDASKWSILTNTGGTVSQGNGARAQLYSEATQLGYTRMTDWTGYYPDFDPNAQIDAAALYLHPDKWSSIQQLNTAFLAHQLG